MSTTIRTVQFTKAQAILRAVTASNDIAAVYGPPGSGKSRAVEHFLTQDPSMHGRAWRRLQMPYRPSPKELSVRLLRDLGAPTTGTGYELSDRVTETLKGSNMVITVDEAHHLNASGLQQLRYLHDRSERSWALVLVGSDIDKVLGTAAELRSRVSGWADFTPLTGAEMIATAKQLHPALHALSNDTIRLVDKRFARGNLRDWIHFSEQVTRLAGQSAITQRHIDAALEMLTVRR
ncbi:ATP-binding protein [Janibacter sp. Y6]|uniref:AAA family ATPase n=1 Tax=Janibacter sp. Y6 TaxID=2913552 RepID=UPI0034A4536E